RDLPTLKAAVIVACAFTAFLIACLLLRVFRSGKRLKKTRKYDIITTPAERVEMAPLNEEDDEDEDSTVFDIKYRSGKRLKKTRKYDIITTPAERVEMAPLNEEDDEDEDSTVFDIKYSVFMGQTGDYMAAVHPLPFGLELPLTLAFSTSAAE
ncbi:Membrane protein FAM174B, partial [Myotis brandtii]